MLLIFYLGISYYTTKKIKDYIVSNYHGKSITLKDIKGDEYYVSFKDIAQNLLPTKIGVNIVDWVENSENFEFTYKNPIFIGYDVIAQKIVARYEGDVIINKKSDNSKYMMKINNYEIGAKFFAWHIFKDIIKIKNSFELLNYLDYFVMSSDDVEIIKLFDNSRIYHKEYEKNILSFLPRKYYTSIDDFLSNLPKKCESIFTVKVNEIEAESNQLDNGLFYMFYQWPNGFFGDFVINLNNDSNDFNSFYRNLDFDIKSKFGTPTMNCEEFNVTYNSEGNGLNQKNGLVFNIKFDIKNGFFHKLFDWYNQIKSQSMKQNPIFEMIVQNVDYVINNREYFQLPKLEDSRYFFSGKINSDENSNNIKLYIDNLTLASGDSSIQITNRSDVNKLHDREMRTRGVILIKSYEHIISFIERYFYEIPILKYIFPNLEQKTKELYVSATKKFLKKISDHPDSDSNDLSFEYDIDTKNILKSKIGSVDLSQIKEFYNIVLITTAYEQVNKERDVLKHMKKILPDLDVNSSILKKVIDGHKIIMDISVSPHDVTNGLKKNLPKLQK